MSGLGQDLRYAARALNRSRGFALTVVLVTALGVGANTATFTVADFVLLRPFPFRDAESLVRLCAGPRQGGGWGCMNQLSPANYRDALAMSTSFGEFGAFNRTTVNLVGQGEPLRVPAARVTSDVFPLLGVPALRGRSFDSATLSDAGSRTVVISHGLWQTYFGGDTGVLGRAIRLNGEPYQVVGVMPPGFFFPTRDVGIWLPLVLREEDYANRANSSMEAVGRLKPGITFERARAELQTVAARLRTMYPEANAERGFSFFRQRDEMPARFRTLLFALCAASLSLLLLTGANLASLLLVRAAGRENELAVRTALGARRTRLVRQMLTESMLLAVIGGVVGAVVAVLTIPLLASLIPTTLPLADRPHLDLRILAIGAGFTAITGIGFGLIPAWRAGGQAGFDALREGTRGSGGRRQPLRSMLVAIEVAVSVVLLVSAGLLTRAVMRVQAVSPGFSFDGVLTLRTTLPSPRYDDSVRRAEFYRRVLADVRALPGVRGAAYTSGLPMVFTGGLAPVTIPGREDQRGPDNLSSWRLITPQFFATLGIPVVRGRDFEDTDAVDRPLVAVVSESFATRHWPGLDPIGRMFRIRAQERLVVGVVADIKVRGPEIPSEPQVYLPSRQIPPGAGGAYLPNDLIIRATAPVATLLPSVRRIIRSVDPEQPISDVRMLSDVVTGQTESREAHLRIVGSLAVLAILLTVVGIHGLLAFMVAQRSREIGVRLALGASPSGVARMIVVEGARLALLGAVPGVLLAYAAARAMNSLLFGVGPGDPLILGGGALVVLLTTFVGCLLPAVKALRVDPMTAMRAQ